MTGREASFRPRHRRRAGRTLSGPPFFAAVRTLLRPALVALATPALAAPLNAGW
jgi:hypothetical protein